AGGIGVTPLLSMVRTMADRDDPRPVVLFYGATDWENVTFREELEALRTRLRLEVVLVLEHPHAGWTGETGRIDATLLAKRLPKGRERLQYFVCGPTPMMDAMERALCTLGIAPERVHTERFDLV